MAKIINLLPHTLHLANQQDQIVASISSSGNAVVASVRGPVLEDPEIPVVLQERRLRDVVRGLPEPQEGTWYVVNPFVAAICTDREDLLVAGVGPREDIVRARGSHPTAIKTLIKITR